MNDHPASTPACPQDAVRSEAARLRALERYRILDTAPEPLFDDIARLAADICEAPVAVVNFIADGRQWFKAEVGIGARELPLDVSICRHAILQPGLFVVPDLTKDGRFAGNPLVAVADGLRFYAGALLETPEGLPLGTICVLDTKARPEGVTARQGRMLQALARQVMSELEMRRALVERNAEVAQGLTSAAALRETTRRLDAIINNTMMAIFVMDDRQHCVFMNKAAETLTGYRLAETQGRPLHDVVHHKYPDGRHYPLEECPIDRAFPERNQMQGEELFVHKDGSFYPVAFTASPIRDESGEPIGTIIEVRGIAGEKAQKAAARETEERYRLASLATNDAIWDWDLVNNRVLWNEALQTSYGHRLDRLDEAGEWWIEHIHPDDRDRVDRTIHDVIDGAAERWSEEYRFRRADGSYAEVLDRGHVIRDASGRATRMIGAMLDLTERHAAEAALRESEAKFQAIANSVDQMIWSTQPDGYHDYFNQRWYDYTGVPEGSTDGEAWIGIFHPEDQEHSRQLWLRCLATGDPYHIEYRLRHRSGQYRWVIGRAHPVRDDAGSITRWYGTCTDIHDLKVAEAELQRTSALLGLIGDSAPDMIYAKDRHSRVLYANASAARVIGRPLEQIVGHTDFDWAANAAEAAAIVENDRRVIEAGETLDSDETFTGPAGEVRHYRSVKSPLRDNAGAIIGLVGISSDVTERRQAQERERLLAREVDHRAKNMLAVVQSVVQLTRADDMATFAAAIGGRIQSLARAHSLLAASRWEGADLRQLVTEELAPFTSRDASHVQISGPAIRLRPEAAQALALVVHELATNAAKYGALSAPVGELRIAWTVATQGSGESRLDLRWHERGGPPVSAPTRRGFGSTVMRASVERQLKGTVSLDWDPAGLVCELTLPAEQLVATGASRTEAGAARHKEPPARNPRVEGCRVLVLEDEALIAMQVEDALSAVGCLVVGPATRIPEAFDLIYAAEIDAALLDINVAGERSFAVADILASKGIAFAFVTGFDAASTVPARFQGAPVIAKPFETAKLTAIVERLCPRG
jgi:PAS domain S-box-containing protein